MMKPVRPDPEAETEITHEIRFYERESAGLGDELWSEIQHTVQLISEHPLIGGIVPRVQLTPLVRRIRLRRFPFYLVYREFDDEIELVALAPMRKRPRYWHTRLE
ncbi:MAG: type II toxin-antitoxin system RelE/ParE family toxin [Acidobacteriota bacterium]